MTPLSQVTVHVLAVSLKLDELQFAAARQTFTARAGVAEKTAAASANADIMIFANFIQIPFGCAPKGGGTLKKAAIERPHPLSIYGGRNPAIQQRDIWFYVHIRAHLLSSFSVLGFLSDTCGLYHESIFRQSRKTACRQL
jgi:hypothetical protein